jgi:hypothetical protein
MSRDVADHIAGEDVHGRAERDGGMGVVATHALTRPVGIGRPAVASEEEGLDISETGMYGYPRAVHARRRRPRALRWSPATPQCRRRQDELRDG